MSKVVAIIPARYASSRFLGKPLALLKGQPMVAWVIQRCLQVKAFANVIVATDDERIAQVAQHAGAEAVMTHSNHASGSDRVWEAASDLPDAEIIVNVQGDEPFINPDELSQLVTLLTTNAVSADVATMICPITDVEEFNNPNIVKAVVAKDNKVLYFSRSPIPFHRQSQQDNAPLGYRHIGVYAYRRDALQAFVKQPMTTLEQTECLEQLRGLHYGLTYIALIVPKAPIGVDTPEDLQRLEDEACLETSFTKSTSSVTTRGA